MDMTVEEFNKYKELNKLYKGKELIDVCRENGILLWAHERQVRNEREKQKRKRERKMNNGN